MSRQQVNHREATGLIRARARALQHPLSVLRAQVQGGGLITTSGYLTHCGASYYLTPTCPCVRHCTPELNCRQCRGTGQA
ncbi:hypothetical protein [Deinococcus sp. JMULE3]|uniref:hypothetical protein n=1 Tax=Deinococcus sp. JMULE3 TaxID=2518341 RepID=UPI001576ADA6|nr:hypothetical protein [Deinococcus sp. JMULE3]NTX99245.1 hypothetical protein [Deinococcus sp. JMULE3]